MVAGCHRRTDGALFTMTSTSGPASQGGVRPSHSGRGSNVLAPTAFDEASTSDPAPGFTVFAAMPFDPSFDDVFHVAIKPAVNAVGGEAVRIDQVMHASDAVSATWGAIEQASVVVADVSTSEPDVLYELGLAHAMGKPALQICSSEYRGLPFMIRNRETLLYQLGQTYLLAERLKVYLRTIIDGRI
jgi:hypothetical protein